MPMGGAPTWSSRGVQLNAPTFERPYVGVVYYAQNRVCISGHGLSTYRRRGGGAQAAEAQGYESFWLTEGANRDSISQLAYLAAKTSRIKLGTGIITIFSRTPVMVAQTAAGMMELSGGRFILGLGTGHKASVERVQGQVFSKPASRTRDYIRIIRRR